MGVRPHQGTRESRVQGEGAQVSGGLGTVRDARCGAPKQSGPSAEVNSEVVTGELIDPETVTISSEGGRWKSAQRGNSLAAYLTARTVLQPR